MIDLENVKFSAAYWSGAARAYKAEVERLTTAIGLFGDGRIKQWEMAAQAIDELVDRVNRLERGMRLALAKLRPETLCAAEIALASALDGDE